MFKRAFVSKLLRSAGSDRQTGKTGDSPQEPDVPRSLFNDFLDVLRTVLLRFERQSALEWLEALISEEPSAYVDGFGKVAWMSAKLRTVVNGRGLPRESYLVFAGVRLSNSCSAEDEEECFLLGAFLSVIHALLQLDQLELVVQLLENMSEEVLAATLVGMEDLIPCLGAGSPSVVAWMILCSSELWPFGCVGSDSVSVRWSFFCALHSHLQCCIQQQVLEQQSWSRNIRFRCSLV
eukprot:TRINITY_DN11036_c0_g1_i2.p1 TRINITY_DN11036_c0_g1~~TRINITY_DN11036_c0_g1_i2.p1  ORF type:complete len:236 (+),score=22.86 TRINITY_DN11036_c0_g1_i2:99-806(+)